MSNYKVWKNECPLRFVEREGKRILQSPWVSDEGEVIWKDIPLEKERAEDGLS